MNTYLLLLRGINVGGKNKMPLAELKVGLEQQGCTNVLPYIQSGNVIVQSTLLAKTLRQKIESNLPSNFKLDSSNIKVLVLTLEQLQAVIDHKPKGFGDEPEKFYSDVLFLIDIDVDEVMPIFSPKEGVDVIWPGKSLPRHGGGVIYSQRLGAERTKSRLGRIVGTKPYKSMTIRSWNTTTKLLELMKKMESS
jgi:uncharacterized protein (DUF1697 family)